MTAVLVGAAALLPACAVFRKLDMAQVHHPSAQRVERNPVIFLHGFLGSKLENSQAGGTAWGRVRNLFTRNRRDGLDLPIAGASLDRNRDNLVPYEVCDSVGGIDYYGPILRALQEIGGYEPGDIEHPHEGESLYVLTYDWRRDNVETARQLGEAIERIRVAHGRPDLKINLVAHSMGGLVARYFIKYGAVDVLGRTEIPAPSYAGAPYVDKVVLIGTPNEGSMTAFRILNQGVTHALPVEDLFTMPAIYQLLPGREARPFIDSDGASLPVSLRDPDNWLKYGWSTFNPETLAKMRRRLPRAGRDAASFLALRDQMRLFLDLALERADRFHRALAQTGPGEDQVRFFAFGSDCIPTQARTVLHRDGESWKLAFTPEDLSRAGQAELPRELFFTPGDGSVTLASLLAQEPTSEAALAPGISFASTVFVCATHGFLPKNPIFQNNLFHVLSGSCDPLQQPAGSVAAR